MTRFRSRLSRALSRPHSLVGNAAVTALALIGAAVTGYATWRSWRTEADQFRTSYLAGADNRTVAVQHSAEELLARLGGIAQGIRDGSPQTLNTLVDGFIPASYTRGEITLLNAANEPRLRRCVGTCEVPGAGFLQQRAIVEAVSAARGTGRPTATPPLPAPRREGKHTAWISFAIPEVDGQVLLATVDGMDLVEAGLGYLRPYGIDVYLFDETEGRDLAYFHRSRRSKTPADRDPREAIWTADHNSGAFVVAGRTWRVHNEPIRPIREEIGWTPWLVLATGVILTGGVTFTLAGQLRLRLAVEAQVERRTKRLHQANQNLQEEIEQRKRTELELAEARDKALESSRLKSAFLANVSHEIRTPLNGIAGFSQVLLESDLDIEQHEYAQTIVRCASDLAGVINDILDVARIEAGKIDLDPAACGLRSIVHECGASVQPLAAAKGLHFEAALSGALPDQIIADEGRLKQVLRNLLTNAIKFTAEGSVRLECAPDARKPGFVRFAVKDTGCGIHPRDQVRLFDRFTQVDGSFQRVHGGLGLGLAIARELVEMMGGEIGVESEPGSGSLFWISIPRGEQAAAPAGELTLAAH